ncbi:MAG: hypothetical protein KIS85_03165 [Anaerolineales bacterium]|nr:hypothetical protein [Anaerolineales bacterium]
MTSKFAQPQAVTIRWLLDSDPAIHWQVMRDLAAGSPEAVSAERARVAVEGWGARLLSLQGPDGNWGGGAWVHRSWASTMETLMLLREMGLDPTSPQARRAIDLVREKSNWGEWHGHAPFFEGETEPCINGRVLATGAYFGTASDRLAERLLGEQLADGGWNCAAPESKRSSFNSTLCVLEGLLEYERATGDGAVRVARLRGEEYLLERGLFKSKATGKPIGRDRKGGHDWREFVFPPRWRYDILWGLDYLRKAEAAPDERAAEAVALLAARQQPDGRWRLDSVHPGKVHFRMEGHTGTASRWNTLRALRVLKWHSAQP